MAERVIVVCDVCGRASEQTVTFGMGGRSLAKDLCRDHLEEMVRNAHPPTRGRPARGTRSAQGSRTPRSGGAAKRSTAKIPRSRATGATLAKRRAALEKARQALSRKRAEAKKASRYR